MKINYIFMLNKYAETSHGFITMQGHKYSHICNLWGKFLPAGMICTTTDPFSIPVGEMYSHARMFCALAHMSSIPRGAINFYMQRTIFTLADITSFQMLIHPLFPWVQCQSLKPVLSQCSQTGFVTVDDFIALYIHSYVFYSHRCNKFLHARTFFYTHWYDLTNFYQLKFGPLLIEPWS